VIHFDFLVLELSDHGDQVLQGLLRIQTLWTGDGAHADVLAVVQSDTLGDELQSLLRIVVSSIDDPSVGLHQDGRSEVFIRMPPVTWARSRAAGTKDTLVKTVEFLSVLNRLVVFLVQVLLFVTLLQVRLNHLVLGVEIRHVYNQISQDEHVAERRNDGWLADVLIKLLNAGQSMKTVEIHGARTADSFSARPKLS